MPKLSKFAAFWSSRTRLVVFCTAFSVTGFFIVSCKSQPSPGSSLSFGENLDKDHNLDLVNLGLTPAQRDGICGKRPIFIYIGNGERATVDIKGAQGRTNELERQIAKDVEDLKKGLGRMTIFCTTKFSALDGKIPRAMLLTVTDGAGFKDSSIKAVWFTFDGSAAQKAGSGDIVNGYTNGWKTSDTTSWKISESGTLVENPGDVPTEIHLPTQIESIVRNALKMKPKGHPDFEFDQTFYFIKSHGGRFSAEKTDPGIAGLFRQLSSKSTPTYEGHSFLFDPNGPSGEKKVADLFGFGIPNEAGCKKFAELDAKIAVPSASICGVCKKHVATLAGKGPLEQCTKGPAPGIEPATPIKLDPYANDTLDPYANDTLNPYRSGTLDPFANDTLGAGKSGFLNKMPSTDVWPIVFQLASGVQYSGGSLIAGLNHISLPVRGSGDNPPFVVLDSCWGSPDIAKTAFKYDRATTLGDSIVVAINQNPMGVSSINYGAFNAFQYLALPFIQKVSYYNAVLKGGKLDPAVVKAKEALDKIIATQGMINHRNKGQDPGKSARQIRFEVVPVSGIATVK